MINKLIDNNERIRLLLFSSSGHSLQKSQFFKGIRSWLIALSHRMYCDTMLREFSSAIVMMGHLGPTLYMHKIPRSPSDCL